MRCASADQAFRDRDGDDLEFAFQVVNETGNPMALRIDYEIDYMKASGKLAPKRYKCSDKIYGPGIWKVEKKQSFKPISASFLLRRSPSSHCCERQAVGEHGFCAGGCGISRGVMQDDVLTNLRAGRALANL